MDGSLPSYEAAMREARAYLRRRDLSSQDEIPLYFAWQRLYAAANANLSTDFLQETGAERRARQESRLEPRRGIPPPLFTSFDKIHRTSAQASAFLRSRTSSDVAIEMMARRYRREAEKLRSSRKKLVSSLDDAEKRMKKAKRRQKSPMQEVEELLGSIENGDVLSDSDDLLVGKTLKGNLAGTSSVAGKSVKKNKRRTNTDELDDPFGAIGHSQVLPKFKARAAVTKGKLGVGSSKEDELGVGVNRAKAAELRRSSLSKSNPATVPSFSNVANVAAFSARVADWRMPPDIDRVSSAPELSQKQFTASGKRLSGANELRDSALVEGEEGDMTVDARFEGSAQVSDRKMPPNINRASSAPEVSQKRAAARSTLSGKRFSGAIETRESALVDGEEGGTPLDTSFESPAQVSDWKIDRASSAPEVSQKRAASHATLSGKRFSGAIETRDSAPVGDEEGGMTLDSSSGSLGIEQDTFNEDSVSGSPTGIRSTKRKEDVENKTKANQGQPNARAGKPSAGSDTGSSSINVDPGNNGGVSRGTEFHEKLLQLSHAVGEMQVKIQGKQIEVTFKGALGNETRKDESKRNNEALQSSTKSDVTKQPSMAQKVFDTAGYSNQGVDTAEDDEDSTDQVGNEANDVIVPRKQSNVRFAEQGDGKDNYSADHNANDQQPRQSKSEQQKLRCASAVIPPPTYQSQPRQLQNSGTRESKSKRVAAAVENILEEDGDEETKEEEPSGDTQPSRKPQQRTDGEGVPKRQEEEHFDEVDSSTRAESISTRAEFQDAAPKSDDEDTRSERQEREQLRQQTKSVRNFTDDPQNARTHDDPKEDAPLQDNQPSSKREVREENSITRERQTKREQSAYQLRDIDYDAQSFSDVSEDTDDDEEVKDTFVPKEEHKPKEHKPRQSLTEKLSRERSVGATTEASDFDRKRKTSLRHSLNQREVTIQSDFDRDEDFSDGPDTPKMIKRHYRKSADRKLSRNSAEQTQSRRSNSTRQPDKRSRHSLSSGSDSNDSNDSDNDSRDEDLGVGSSKDDFEDELGVGINPAKAVELRKLSLSKSNPGAVPSISTVADIDRVSPAREPFQKEAAAKSTATGKRISGASKLRESPLVEDEEINSAEDVFVPSEKHTYRKPKDHKSRHSRTENSSREHTTLEALDYDRKRKPSSRRSLNQREVTIQSDFDRDEDISDGPDTSDVKRHYRKSADRKLSRNSTEQTQSRRSNFARQHDKRSRHSLSSGSDSDYDSRVEDRSSHRRHHSERVESRHSPRILNHQPRSKKDSTRRHSSRDRYPSPSMDLPPKKIKPTSRSERDSKVQIDSRMKGFSKEAPKLPEGIVWPPGMEEECIARLGLDGHHPIAPPGLEHLVTEEQWGEYWTWLHWYSSWQMWYMKNGKKPKRKSDKEKRSRRYADNDQHNANWWVDVGSSTHKHRRDRYR